MEELTFRECCDILNGSIMLTRTEFEMLNDRIAKFKQDQEELINMLLPFEMKEDKEYLGVYEYLGNLPEEFEGQRITIFPIENKKNIETFTILSTTHGQNNYRRTNVDIQFVSGKVLTIESHEMSALCFRLLGYIEHSYSVESDLRNLIISGGDYQTILDEFLLIPHGIREKVLNTYATNINEVNLKMGDLYVDEIRYEKRLKSKIIYSYKPVKGARK